MDIEASEMSIDKVIRQNEVFDVPSYQRRYSWNEEQSEELWRDLDSIERDENHFLGSIVVLTEVHDPSSFNHLELVDGQQRMTTLLIILSVLRDKYKQFNEETSEEIQNDLLFNSKFDNKAPKLKLGELDDKKFQKILKDKDKEGGSRLEDAYEYFSNKLEGKTREELNEIRDKLLENLSVVLIYSETEKAAFRLFETLNDRGLELSAIDLMKNYLLKKSVERGGINRKKVKEDWKNIIKNLDDVDKKIRLFRHYFMSAKSPETNDKVTQSKVYERFKEIIDEEKGITIEEYTRDMKEQSEVYRDIVTAEVDEFPESVNSKVNFHLRNLRAIGASPARTLILRAFREEINGEDLIELLELIETFTVRRIIGRMTTAPLDRFYNQLALEAFEKENTLETIENFFAENVPNNDEFISNFKDRQHRMNDQTKYLLDTLEREHFMNEGTGKRIQGRYEVHIEHIAPRGTFNAKKYSKWLDYLGVTEEEFEELKDTIGNLTLLEKKLNLKASDNPFQQKKEEYRNSDFKMTEKLLEEEKWSTERIRNRSEELAKIANQIWSFQNEEK